MDQQAIIVKGAIQAWQTQVDRSTQFINSLSEDQLLKEIAPGKNRGVYLVGHLCAVHDALPEILGLGNKNHPDWEHIFLKSPDKSIEKIPTVTELKEAWTAIHRRLQDGFEKMTPGDWFSRHMSMSDEDFAKDPARNKFSVLLNRTSHLAYHFGQLRLLK